MSEKFEKFRRENRLRYSNEFYTKIFIEKSSIMKKFLVENFQIIQKLRGNQYLNFFYPCYPRDDSYEKKYFFTVNKRSYIKKNIRHRLVG